MYAQVHVLYNCECSARPRLDLDVHNALAGSEVSSRQHLLCMQQFGDLGYYRVVAHASGCENLVSL